MSSNKYVEKGEYYLQNCVFKGLAHSYDVSSGKYVKPYPEVTGYVIKYFCDNYEVIPKNIIKAGDNLVRIQDKKLGGYTSFGDKNTLFSFDTSQILIGLAALYKKTGKNKYKEAAIRGGDFLLMMQMDNGAIAPTYNRTKKEIVINKQLYSIWNGPWSGLMCKLTEGFQALYEITDDEKYIEAKRKTASFYTNAEYIECTHPLGYWLEGLYEAGEYQKVRDVLEEKVIPRIHDNGYIPYKENLEYAYVSGCVQLGILLYKLGYVEHAKKIRYYGRLVQKNDNSGGLFQYANSLGELDHHIHTEINSWGTKYFCQLERMMEGED